MRMRRVCFLVFGLIGCVVCINPVMAQGRQTAYPESRRYSIEIPSNWIYETTTNPNYFFVGESLQIADSPETLQIYRETNEVVGQLITLDFLPLSTLELFGWETQNIDERQLLMNAFVGLYTEQDLQFTPIAGYPSATVDLTGISSEFYGGFVFQSAIWVGDVIVYMVTVAGSAQQMAEIDRLLPTFQFYPDPPCSNDFSERSPLVIEGGALSIPLQSCWLVLSEEWVNSPFNLRQQPFPDEVRKAIEQYDLLADIKAQIPPTPYYHIIFWDEPIEFMRRVDEAYLNTEGMENRNLVAGMMQIGVYPYAWFSSNPASDAILQTIFEQIGGYAEDYSITQAPIFTITGRLSQVFDAPDNVGRFMLIADGEYVYVIIIATPSALWSQFAPLADDLLSKVIIGA